MNIELETSVIRCLSKLSLQELLRVRAYLNAWINTRDEELRDKPQPPSGERARYF